MKFTITILYLLLVLPIHKQNDEKNAEKQHREPIETQKNIEDSLLSSDLYTNLCEVLATMEIEQIRTQYEANMHTIEKQKSRYYLVIALLWSISLLLIGWIFYTRKIRVKNFSLVSRINELDCQSRKIDYLEAELKEYIDIKKEKDSCDNILYNEVKQLMKDPSIFTNSSFDKKRFIEMLNTNEKHLSQSIKTNLGITINEYINQMRLNYAKELLSDKSNIYSFETIAIESGFESKTTFHKLFKEHYGISPNEFRNIYLNIC